MNRILSIFLVLSLLVMLFGCTAQNVTPTNVTNTDAPPAQGVAPSAGPEESQPEESVVSKEESKPTSKPASSKAEKEPAQESSLDSPLPAELDYSPKEGVPREELKLCTQTTGDDYVLGVISVAIQRTYSKVNRVWTAQHFPELSGIVEMEDITYEETPEFIAFWEKKENFHQLINIYISDQSKEAVMDGIQALEKSNPYIYYAATRPAEQMQIE